MKDYDLKIKTSVGNWMYVDYIDGIADVYDANDNYVASISADREAMDRMVRDIKSGEDPIIDGWEDGNGNTLSI